MPLANSIAWRGEVQIFRRLVSRYLHAGRLRGDLPQRLDVVREEIRRIDREVKKR